MTGARDGAKKNEAAINRAAKNLPVAIGRITRPHGIYGEAKLSVFFEDALFEQVNRTITIAPEDGETEPFEAILESIRGAGKELIVGLSGIKTPEEIKRFAPALIKAEKKDIPALPEGSYFFEEIIGLPVFTPEGESIGKLDDFFSAGEKDVWVISGAGGEETMIPCTDDTLIEVDLENERIVMKPMEEF